MLSRSPGSGPPRFGAARHPCPSPDKSTSGVFPSLPPRRADPHSYQRVGHSVSLEPPWRRAK
eukprot:8266748-Pyramimonas_sp.AAC.1